MSILRSAVGSRGSKLRRGPSFLGSNGVVVPSAEAALERAVEPPAALGIGGDLQMRGQRLGGRQRLYFLAVRLRFRLAFEGRANHHEILGIRIHRERVYPYTRTQTPAVRVPTRAATRPPRAGNSAQERRALSKKQIFEAVPSVFSVSSQPSALRQEPRVQFLRCCCR